MITAPLDTWCFCGCFYLFLHWCFCADSPSLHSREACAILGHQHSWQNLFLSFPSLVWMRETDLKDKGYPVQWNDLPYLLPCPCGMWAPVLCSVLDILLLCCSTFLILIDFTTSASAPGMLPSKGAMNRMSEMGCVNPPIDSYVFSDLDCAGNGEWRRHSSLLIPQRHWQLPGLLGQARASKSALMVQFRCCFLFFSSLCVFKLIWSSDYSAPCTEWSSP